MGHADVASIAERRQRRSRRAPGEPEPASRYTPRGSIRTPIRTVVLHSDAAWRDDVSLALGTDDITVVGSVDSAEAIAGLGADVVVVAHRHPGTSAVDVCERLRGLSPCPAFVVVASEPRAVLLRRVVQAGATAFVAAASPAGVLRDAVRCVASGRAYFDPAVGHLVVELITRRRPEGQPYNLTPAELDVVALLPKGLPNREIAAELGISENTVKTHLRHALRKLKVRDRAQAAALVVRENLG